jgi:hypothetical protein
MFSGDPYEHPDLRALYGPAELRRREARLADARQENARKPWESRPLALPSAPAPKSAAVVPALSAQPFDAATHNGWRKGDRDTSAWDTAGGIKELVEASKREEHALKTETQEWDISKLWETDAPVDNPRPPQGQPSADEVWLAEQIATQDSKWAKRDRVWPEYWAGLDAKLDKLSWGGYRSALEESCIDVWAAEALHINTSELYAIKAQPVNI